MQIRRTRRRVHATCAQVLMFLDNARMAATRLRRERQQVSQSLMDHVQPWWRSNNAAVVVEVTPLEMSICPDMQLGGT
jgi:hypothetical protein